MNLVEIVVSLSEVVQVYVEGHSVLYLVCNYYVNMTSMYPDDRVFAAFCN